MYQNTFVHEKKKKLGSAYIISRNQEEVRIKYCANYHIDSNNPDYDFFTLNVKNVPAFNKAFLKVFNTSDGGMYLENVKANGEVINIGMDMKKHSVDNMTIWNNTDQENPKMLKISFEKGQVDWKHRLPTAEMVWLTETLQKIYDAWQQEIHSPGRVISIEEYINHSNNPNPPSTSKIIDMVTNMMNNFEPGKPYTGRTGLIINISGQELEYEWLNQHFRIKKSEVDCIYFMVTDEAYVIHISDYKKRIRGIIEISQPNLARFEKLFADHGYKAYVAVFGELSDRLCFSETTLLTNNGEFAYTDIKQITIAEDACFHGEHYICICHQNNQEIYRYKTEFPHALEKVMQYKQLSIPIEVLPKVVANARDNYWDRYNKARLYDHKYSYTLYAIFDTRIRLRHFKYDEHGSDRGVEFKLEESCLSKQAAKWVIDQLRYMRSHLKIDEDHWGHFKDDIVECSIHDALYSDKLDKIKIYITNDSVCNELIINPVQDFIDNMLNYISEKPV